MKAAAALALSMLFLTSLLPAERVTRPPAGSTLPQIAVYVDVTGLTREAQEQALNAGRQFLRRNVNSQRMAAVYVFDGKTTSLVQDFTADLTQLNHAIDHEISIMKGVDRVPDPARTAAFLNAVQMARAMKGPKEMAFYVRIPLTMDSRQADSLTDLAVKHEMKFSPIDESGRVHALSFGN